MYPSTLSVLSVMSLLASATPVHASRKAHAGTLGPRAPLPAAAAQHAPPAPHRHRRRSLSSSDRPLVTKRRRSSTSPLVKKRKRSPQPGPAANPKYQRHIIPNSKKRSSSSSSTSTSPSYSLSQSSMGGYSFFDDWDFFTAPDPTHGQVNFNSASESWDNGLVYVPNPGQNSTVMRVDSWTTLPYGALRNSVRISSKQTVSIGSLVIADIAQIPWGPTVWPAFWMVGDNWPMGGEIDIIEGVHDSVQNQYTLHTAPGCTLTTPMQAAGAVLATDCDAYANYNTGCGVQDTSRESYGSGWNAAGGGVYAMLWDETGISMYNFIRDQIPSDITSGSPDPSSWGTPRARWDATSCNMTQFFGDQTIVFDITLGGDWAGSTYQSAGFSGTWQSAIEDPTNFVNAVWEVNSVKVYTQN
ncbi:hypothetical protein JCM1841_006837 [Sporobolomyces salmonicolor]